MAKVNRNIDWLTDDNGYVVGFQIRHQDQHFLPRFDAEDPAALISPGGLSFSLMAFVARTRTPSLAYIAPAATFTSLTAADSVATPGKLQVSSAGVHGLTAGASLAGKYVHVTWSGTDHTGVDGFYKIKTVDSTKIITLDTSSAGVADMGTPTLKVAGDAVTLYSATIPAGLMSATGRLRYVVMVSHTTSANAKTISVTYGGTAFTTIAPTASDASYIDKTITNRAAAVQVAPALAATGPGSAGALVTGTVDTAAAQTFAISVTPAAENEVIQIETVDISVER